MTTEQNKTVVSEDEISLKDLILKIKEFGHLVLRSWKIVLLFIIISVLYQIFSIYTHKIKYTADLSLMINEDESSGLGGIGSLLGSFGGLLGGSSEYNLDKILEISQSDRIGEKILLHKLSIGNSEDYIGNLLIESLEEHDEWINIGLKDRLILSKEKIEKKKKRKAFRFTQDSINYGNLTEAYVLKKLLQVLYGNKAAKEKGIVTSEYGELTSIMVLRCSSYIEELSIQITNLLFEELKTFYIDKSVAKQKQTFEIMKSKHDSIYNVLISNELSYAKYQDTGRDLFRFSDKVKADQLRRNITINTIALGKAKENLEIADFALRKQTPLIQVIDRPFAPLDDSKPTLLFSLILGVLIGGFASILFIISRKIYSDIMIG